MSTVPVWMSMRRLFRENCLFRTAWNQQKLLQDGSRNFTTVPVDAQSYVLPGEERIHVSALLEDPNKLMSVPTEFKNVNTVYDVLKRCLDLYGRKPCLGTRDSRTGKYEWLDFQQVFERSIYTGSAFQEFGVSPDNGSFVGINCKNISEFNYAYLGCSAFSNVFIPLYDNLDRNAIKYIVSTTEIPLFICDTEAKARLLIQEKASFPKLRTLVTVPRPSRDLVADAKAVGLEVIGFLDFELKGKVRQKYPVPPKSDDLFAICWTSGTTGIPKGVLLTHRNVVSTLVCVQASLHPAELGKGSVISYMPTGHIYEILIQLHVLGHGGSVGHFGGDVMKLMDDILTLKPKFIPMVPRLLNRLYAKAQDDIKRSALKSLLLPLALKRKEAQLKRGVVSHNTVWDKVVFKSVREMFGDNVEVMSNSSAPLSPEVTKFFRCALGCHIFDAYGQTETGPLSLTIPGEYDGGNVGAPCPTTQLKLADVPEMNYYTKDNVGEVCARGPSVCLGYYKNPEATKDTIDENGWIYTGDIGQWQPNGTLKIIDRKKNFFKMSQGEYIAPDKLESSYGQSPIVAQIFVEGRPEEHFLVAVVVPDPLAFHVWAKRKDLTKASLDEHCQNPKVKSLVLQHLRKLGKKNGMNSLELIQNVHLLPDMMTAESGLLTPTLKIKRNVAKKTFKDVIDKMYKDGPIVE